MKRVCPSCGTVNTVPDDADPTFCANGHDDPDGIEMVAQ